MTDTVFIGMEDGVAVYAKRETLSGVDRAMMRDQFRRELLMRTIEARSEIHAKKEDDAHDLVQQITKGTDNG